MNGKNDYIIENFMKNLKKAGVGGLARATVRPSLIEALEAKDKVHKEQIKKIIDDMPKSEPHFCKGRTCGHFLIDPTKTNAYQEELKKEFNL